MGPRRRRALIQSAATALLIGAVLLLALAVVAVSCSVVPRG